MGLSMESIETGICDLCGTRRYGTPGGAGPEGFAGTVLDPASGHARDPVAWFACRRTHIGPAVRAALDAAGASL